jgi:hypothetical protein
VSLFGAPDSFLGYHHCAIFSKGVQVMGFRMEKNDRRKRRDRVAREAARLLETGRVADIDQAIQLAAEAVGGGRGGRRSLPGRERVRKHARAMAMQALGDAGYAQFQREYLRLAEDVMTTLERAFPDAETRFVGRAAEGHIDAGATVHIRIYGNIALDGLARSLVEVGYDEPVFETIEARFGRVNRLRFVEGGIEIAVTRCRPSMLDSAAERFVTRRKITVMTLAELRAKLAA